MKVSDVHFPWKAYTLHGSFSWTHNVSVQDYLKMTLNHSVSLRRMKVHHEWTVHLSKGSGGAGLRPKGMPQYCTSFALLCCLGQGQMDQEIFVKSTGTM
jgi:hypothetical protein